MPLLSVLIGAGAAWTASGLTVQLNPTFLRLVVESTILFGVYLLTLLFVMGQKTVYVSLLKEIGLWPAANRRGSN